MNKKITLVLYDRRHWKEYPGWKEAQFQVKQITNSIDWTVDQKLSKTEVSRIIKDLPDTEVKIIRDPTEI